MWCSCNHLHINHCMWHVDDFILISDWTVSESEILLFRIREIVIQNGTQTGFCDFYKWNKGRYTCCDLVTYGLLTSYGIKVVLFYTTCRMRCTTMLMHTLQLNFIDRMQPNHIVYIGLNSPTKHVIMKLITSFHSESTAHSNDISISYYEEIYKISENPLIIDLAFHQNFAIFAMCSKH